MNWPLQLERLLRYWLARLLVQRLCLLRVMVHELLLPGLYLQAILTVPPARMLHCQRLARNAHLEEMHHQKKLVQPSLILVLLPRLQLAFFCCLQDLLLLPWPCCFVSLLCLWPSPWLSPWPLALELVLELVLLLVLRWALVLSLHSVLMRSLPSATLSERLAGALLEEQLTPPSSA